MLYLPDSDLLDHCRTIGTKLPFSLSSLRKDRMDGRLGVPYRRVGGMCLYNPQEVLLWLAGKPIVQPKPSPSTASIGASTKAERVEAKRRGVTVKELRKGGV